MEVLGIFLKICNNIQIVFWRVSFNYYFFFFFFKKVVCFFREIGIVVVIQFHEIFCCIVVVVEVFCLQLQKSDVKVWRVRQQQSKLGYLIPKGMNKDFFFKFKKEQVIYIYGDNIFFSFHKMAQGGTPKHDRKFVKLNIVISISRKKCQQKIFHSSYFFRIF